MEKEFKKQLEVGARGEERVLAALNARSNLNVEDVRNNPEYQKKDIDFVVTNGKGQVLTLEVKNDVRSNQTRNVYVECYNVNNRSRNGFGWLYYTEALFLGFIQEDYNKLHIVGTEQIRQLCESGKYPIKSTTYSSGYCIPVSVIMGLSTYYGVEI